MYRAVLLVAVAVGLPAFGADDSPLRIRNLAPASGIYGEPRPLGGEVLSSGYELTFNTEVANNFTSDASGQTLAFFDGETTYFTYGFRQAVADGFEWGIEVPWITQYGGQLDHPIEKFHDVFNFPNNGRTRAKLNKIDYFISDQNKVYVDFQDEKDGFGDVRVSGGYQLLRTPERSLALRALVKLPTGDVAKLTGSNGTDVASWLDYTDRELLARLHLSMTAAIGVMVLGDGDLLPKDQNRFAGYGHFGLSYPFSDAWSLKAQLDYHTQLIDTSVDQLGGEALQGSFGASWQVTPRFWSELAMAEDLTSGSTSDVMIQFLLGTTF
jgi:hypothetical protein